ncbi:MAG: ATP-binding cassette domain-containing protein, partial [Deltaproteobacteria bacterium]|nr:ATP-binding cassette domain-containing protein [Deltaproteobacteria bacterium]
MSAAIAVVFSDVGFAYADSAPILRGVDLRFEAGFTALVGANGAGKSTLLAMITGALTPEDGAVRIEPPGALVVHCPQSVEAKTVGIVGFASAAGKPSARLRARLGLDPGQLARWQTLSEGERKRWQVGAALAQDPDVLLLDEPTNHLDQSARAHLTGALR